MSLSLRKARWKNKGEKKITKHIVALLKKLLRNLPEVIMTKKFVTPVGIPAHIRTGHLPNCDSNALAIEPSYSASSV